DLMQIGSRSRVTGVINLGGGSSRSFVQQMEAASNIIKTPPRGHKYAIQISTEQPAHNGRTSPNTDDESLVFGKLARGAATAYVNCDATIALPLLVTALSQTAAKYMKGRKRPNFTFMGKDLTVEVP
ncbi:MAG TPA: deoxyhypusine synthase family protein, partial [Pyrinomonadaceae bacterium]|nr:deoxyhypusine synthase family protein [Pyrinomonadaceae bacterium]HVF50566.1 deoxyhypusine synthase family protein [Pyrinomonadaceae bacterium]